MLVRKHVFFVEKRHSHKREKNSVLFPYLCIFAAQKISSGAQAYDTLITSTLTSPDMKGGGIFPTGDKVLEKGTYYLIEEAAPTGYRKNDQAVKVIVDDTGVYADAGTSGDGVTVLRGAGSILKSMLQFAADDHVDTTLHDIKAVLQTGSLTGNSLTWNSIDESSWDDALHLNYKNGNAALEYGSRDGSQPALEVDEGWGRLSIRQCFKHDDSVNSDLKTDLGTKDLTNLFSGTCTVRMTNYKDGTGYLRISKTVTGGGDTQREFSFTVTLTDVRGNPLSGSYSYSGSKSGTIQSGDQITLKHNESVTIQLPPATRYTVTEAPADGYTTTATGDTGIIYADKTSQADFVNDMPVSPTPSPSPCPTPSEQPDVPEGTGSAGTPTSPPVSGLPETGDPSLTWLWALLCAACVGGLFLTFRDVFSHKSKNSRK